MAFLTRLGLRQLYTYRTPLLPSIPDLYNLYVQKLPINKIHVTFSNSSKSYDESRPFRILGIQQIAIGSLDKSPLVHLWGDLFGLKKVGEYKSVTENVDEDIYILEDNVEVDLMQPIDSERSPKVHKPPLNHIGLWVDNLKAAVEWLENLDQGVRFTPGGIRKGASGHDVAFIHPVASDEMPVGGCGVLIELVQAPKTILEARKSDHQ